MGGQWGPRCPPTGTLAPRAPGHAPPRRAALPPHARRPRQAFALLANLAVAPSTRRSGLARELCARCEEAGRGWGFPAIFLQVDEANGAARGLYGALGYQEAFRTDTTALRLSPGAEQLLRNEKATLLGMAKGL